MVLRPLRLDVSNLLLLYTLFDTFDKFWFVLISTLAEYIFFLKKIGRLDVKKMMVDKGGGVKGDKRPNTALTWTLKG